jgi:3-deoxy-D-manno-octulosonic-acid transferase
LSKNNQRRYALPCGQSKEGPLQKFARCLYTGLMLVLLPVAAMYLLHRARKQPAYLNGWGERFFGHVRRPRFDVDAGHAAGIDKVRIWVHAVSVGETHAVAPLVRALCQIHSDIEWVFSCATPTGQDTAKGLFGALSCAEFVYLPYDIACNLRRFVRTIRPSLLCLVETELWPNLLAVCEQADVPVALVNARVSPRTARGLMQLSLLSRPAVARLSLLVAQTQADADTFTQLGRGEQVIAGNMKFDVVPSSEVLALGRRWRQNWLGKRGIVLFASSREGEEALFLKAWQHCAARGVDALIVPRHPQRFDEVAHLAQAMGFAVVRRSQQWAAPASGANQPVVYLGDSMGEMPAYYALADVACMGGSWLPHGGQNLIEACACGCPVVFGAHTFNFKLAASDALRAGAGRYFQTFDEALPVVLEVLACDAQLQAWRGRALAYFQAHQGATQRTLEALRPLLRRLGGVLL